jgi:hypothetical protein
MHLQYYTNFMLSCTATSRHQWIGLLLKVSIILSKNQSFCSTILSQYLELKKIHVAFEVQMHNHLMILNESNFFKMASQQPFF